jgi:integrase
MRAGEIRGLRGEYVFDDYIYVCGSFGEYGYGPTKTKKNRFNPLIPEMIGLLKNLMEKNGKGYVFSLTGGDKPVSRKHIYDEYHRALKRIGIDQREITRRGLSVHSWRHFLNTELQVEGVTLEQVQAVTGHQSRQMTERYSQFDVRQIPGVMEVQHVIAGNKKPGKTGEGAHGEVQQPAAPDMAGRVVSFPAQGGVKKRKGA